MNLRRRGRALAILATTVVVSGATLGMTASAAHAAYPVVSIGYKQVGGTGGNPVWPITDINTTQQASAVTVNIDGVHIDITSVAPSAWSVNGGGCVRDASKPITAYHIAVSCPVLNETDLETGPGADNITIKNRYNNIAVDSGAGDDQVHTSSTHFQYVNLDDGNDKAWVTAPSTGQVSQVSGGEGDDEMWSLPAPVGTYSHAVFLYGNHGADTFHAANGFYDDIFCGRKWSKQLNKWVNDGAKDVVERDAKDHVNNCP